MSRTGSTGSHDDAFGDTPPHGVPQVTRAAAVDDGSAAAENGDLPVDDEDGAARDGAPGRGTRPPTRRRRRLTRRGRRLLVALVAVLVVLAGAVAWYEVEANPLGSPGKPVLVKVRPGESLDAIDSTLADDEVIGTSVAFQVWSFVHGAPVVEPGLYQLHQNLSFSAAADALDAGPNVDELTVVPGMTVSEVAGELAALPGDLARPFSAAGAADGVHSPFQPSAGSPLEGLIAPGTYEILPGESGHALLEQMVRRFDAEAAAAGLTPSTKVGGLDAYQLVTVASIAQKEGYFTRYLGEVARVIFNRLAAGMRLDMTSTVLYSLGKDGGPVTPAEEQTTTPYNTYLHAGLTPTPICTPSMQALRAAVDPPAGPWLYFDLVTAKKGIMDFATTYTGQLALERRAAANAAKQSAHSAQPKDASSGPASGSTT